MGTLHQHGDLSKKCLASPLPPPPFLPCVQTLRFFLQQEGDLRSSSSPPSPLAHPPLFPCAQALRVFLQQEGDLRSSEAWARLQPAKDVIGSIVSSTARFFKDLVSVGCGGYIGGEDLRETARRIGGIAAHPTLLPFPAHRSEGEVPPLQWRQHSPPPPSEASARK